MRTITIDYVPDPKSRTLGWFIIAHRCEAQSLPVDLNIKMNMSRWASGSGIEIEEWSGECEICGQKYKVRR